MTPPFLLTHLIHRVSSLLLRILNTMLNFIWLDFVPFLGKLVLQTRPALLGFLIYSRHHPHQPVPALLSIATVILLCDPRLPV